MISWGFGSALSLQYTNKQIPNTKFQAPSSKSQTNEALCSIEFGSWDLGFVVLV
jgi:hypothetical protein